MSKKVPRGDRRKGVTSATFHACFPECSSKGHQAFLPCDEGTLSAVKLPLPSKELLLQLNNHYQQGRQGPTLVNKQRSTSRRGSEPR
jgi:hypothetical protein